MIRVRRDVVQRMIAKGNVEAKTSYRYDGRAVTSENDPDNDWKPARLSSGYGDFLDGHYNFHSYWFKSKTGYAWRREDGTIEIWSAGQAAVLRVKDGH